jgi:uncharacterized protein YjbJ (UPF0337 family)
MNKDQVKGSAKQVAGKVQSKAGKAVGSEKHQAKGLLKEVAGAFQKGYGDGRENERKRDERR